MIIELSGIPGSGKSTILNLLKNNLESDKYIFNIRKYILGFTENTLIFDIYLLINFYRIKKKDCFLLIKIINYIFISKNSFFHKLNIFRNSYKKIIINEIIKKNNDKVFFVDEGLTHIPFNLFVDNNQEIDKKKVVKLINDLPKPDLLLIIDAPDEILIKRVISRGKKGHRRINFDSNNEIVKFMEQSRVILEIIKKQVKHKLYVNIEEKIDIKKILNLIGVDNV